MFRKICVFVFLIISPDKILAEEIVTIYTLDFSIERQKQFPEYRKIVDEYYSDLIGQLEYMREDFNKETHLPFDVFDLNDDGTPEIFTNDRSGVFSGAKGYKCDILQERKDFVYSDISRLWCYHNETMVLKNKTKGYHDLATKVTQNYLKKIDIYKWSGDKYDFSHFISSH